MEPHDNGPLFTEMHVLYRLGLEQHRADWKPRLIIRSSFDSFLIFQPLGLARLALLAFLCFTAADP